MKTGHSKWLKRYVVIAGLTIAWFNKKNEFKHKLQPMGVIGLNQCTINHGLDGFFAQKCFQIIKQQQNYIQTVFNFKTETNKTCKRWIKHLKTAIEECKLIQSTPINQQQAHAFGIYTNSLPFFCALQSGAIVIDDNSSDIDKESGSISNISNPDICLIC